MMTLEADFFTIISDSDEEYLDDPILLIDEGIKLSPSEMQEINFVTQSEKIETKAKFRDKTKNDITSSNNMYLLNQCKSFDIKLVDFMNHPHFNKTVKIKDYKQDSIAIKTNNDSEIFLQQRSLLSSTKAPEKSIKCISQQEYKVTTKQTESKKGKKEKIKQNKSKNTLLVDLKKNTGLIGLKISKVDLFNTNSIEGKKKHEQIERCDYKILAEGNQRNKIANPEKISTHLNDKSDKIPKEDESITEQNQCEILTVSKKMVDIQEKDDAINAKSVKDINAYETGNDDSEFHVPCDNIPEERNSSHDIFKQLQLLEDKILRDEKGIKVIEPPEIGVVRPLAYAVTPTINTSVSKVSESTSGENYLFGMTNNQTNDSTFTISPNTHTQQQNSESQLPIREPPPYESYHIKLNSSNSVSNYQNNHNYMHYQKHMNNYSNAFSNETNLNQSIRLQNRDSYSALPALPAIGDKFDQTKLTNQFAVNNSKKPLLCQVPPMQTSAQQNYYYQYPKSPRMPYRNVQAHQSPIEMNYSVNVPNSVLPAHGSPSQCQPSSHVKFSQMQSSPGNLKKVQLSSKYNTEGQQSSNQHLPVQTSANQFNEFEHPTPSKILVTRTSPIQATEGQSELKQHLLGKSTSYQRSSRIPSQNQSINGYNISNQHSIHDYNTGKISPNLSVNGQLTFNQRMAKQTAPIPSITDKSMPNQHISERSLENFYQYLSSKHFRNGLVNDYPMHNQRSTEQLSSALSNSFQSSPNQLMNGHSTPNQQTSPKISPSQCLAGQLSPNHTSNQPLNGQISPNLPINSQAIQDQRLVGQSSSNLLFDTYTTPNQNKSINIQSAHIQNVPNQNVNDKPFVNHQSHCEKLFLKPRNVANGHIPIQPIPMQPVTGRQRKRQFVPEPRHNESDSIIGYNDQGVIKKINISKNTPVAEKCPKHIEAINKVPHFGVIADPAKRRIDILNLNDLTNGSISNNNKNLDDDSQSSVKIRSDSPKNIKHKKPIHPDFNYADLIKETPMIPKEKPEENLSMPEII